MYATAVRPGSECWAPRGGQASPEECGVRTGGPWPASMAYGGGTAARRRTIGRRRRRGAERGRLKNVSQYPCSNAKISKKLNRSAQSGE
jgi:hypothetical protein